MMLLIIGVLESLVPLLPIVLLVGWQQKLLEILLKILGLAGKFHGAVFAQPFVLAGVERGQNILNADVVLDLLQHLDEIIPAEVAGARQGVDLVDLIEGRQVRELVDQSLDCVTLVERLVERDVACGAVRIRAVAGSYRGILVLVGLLSLAPYG